jgi:isoquinoline 1-oxidoreductase beta subunit
MIFASVRMAPPAGRLLGFSRAGAEVQRGLIDLVARDGWIAALGESWWAADRALHRAAPKFRGRDPDDIMVHLAERMDSGPSTRLFEHGDYAAATEGSRPLAATYSIAATPHRSLEAPSAVARMSGGRLELWVGTQVPDLVRTAAAKAAGLPESQVSLTPMPVGDGSGSAFGIEAAAIATELARHSKRPICLSLPPATAQNQDSARPPLLAKMSALPAGDGTLASWSARLVGAAGTAASLGVVEPPFAPRSVIPPYAIPAIRVDSIDAQISLRTGYMRGGDEAMLCFCTESFVDEMARAMGVDPLGLRIGMLGSAPRLAHALTTAATLGGWDGGRPGSSLGLACASLFGSHIALLVEAGIGADQRVKVSRMVAAVDCGRAINPGLVRQQVEGGLLSALAAATLAAPAVVAGMPRAEPLRGKGYERLADVPEIEIEVIRSSAASGGVSGLGMAVLAPAVANAIAAATGRRLRALPFDPMAEQ